MRPGRRFEFRLALACGLPHPDFLPRNMTVEQMEDVRAYDSIEPIGGYREDYRIAYVCLMLHNLIQAQRGDGKWQSATLDDFMLWPATKRKKKRRKEVQSVEEQKAILLSLVGIKKGAE